MHFQQALAAFALLGSCLAIPTTPKQNTVSTVEKRGILYTVFEHAATESKVEFVKNSGVCETTPGVNQYSGYLSVGEDMYKFFWFFESRNHPQNAPLAAWFNGGPGCSSMIGLFQENGPCHFVEDALEPTLNEHSWNTYANMLYIDQPIGVGFSYGDGEVNSTATAAPYVWKLLQAFYDHFPQYESRDFGLFTESYGGHYGPEFASYIQNQNAMVKAGEVQGEEINLVALGINNGIIDADIQEKAYIDFSFNNSYRALISAEDRKNYLSKYENKCHPAIQKCQSTGTDDACQDAANTCSDTIENPITMESDFDVYDIRQGSNDPYPPSTYQDYLQRPDIQKKIGARSLYSDCASSTSRRFSATGDDPRTFLPHLSEVVQSGISVLLWAGDADWICNWLGNYEVANVVEYSGQEEFQGKDLQPYHVNGNQTGEFKSVDNFSFLKVYQAGHEVPYYQPETALQVFQQTMQKKPIFST